MTFCQTSQSSCQIQSDPWVNTFSSTTTEFNQTGTYYAINSVEFQVQIVVGQHFSSNLDKDVLVVDQVLYTCGTNAVTFTTASISSTQSLSCAGVGTLVVEPGYDPIPNVNIQQILYLGSQGIGGICYGAGSSCPVSSSTVTTTAQPAATDPTATVSSASYNIPVAVTTTTTPVPAAVVPSVISCITSASPAANLPSVVSSTGVHVAQGTAVTTVGNPYAAPISNTYRTNLYASGAFGSFDASFLFLLALPFFAF
ncbi:hypothetical protein HK100_011296 [Physocladia obscura]|uniref:Uncharacterized protein n=1 Tax=Physocladia obscura TaxID=109957 RepID=A0AAD5T411_9FUNG|nr:hypothetical protein HK100_011296 [Physocladia obscura]